MKSFVTVGSVDPDPVGSAAASDIAVLRRPELIAQGRDDASIAADHRHGRLVTLRPGCYGDPGLLSTLPAPGRHRLLIDDVLSDVSRDSIVSHVSAAVLWDLPLWNAPLARVHVCRVSQGGAHRTRWVHVHDAEAGIPVGIVDGHRTTSPARAVIDCARMLPFESGVVLADAALHRELVTVEDLEIELARTARRHGNGRARGVVSAADGRSESVGESRSRVVFHKLGLPAMELQYEIRDSHGLFIARTDFAIPELRLVGEFDGKVKYGALRRPGQSSSDVVFAEKRREDAVRDLGWGVVRWVWQELDTPGVVADRWRRAIARARARSAAP